MGESGYTGLGAGIITSGTLLDSVIPSGITRDTELTSGLATKQNASANLTTFAGITPSANVLSLLGAADYPAIKGLLDLESGIDFLSPAGVNSAIISGVAGKQDTNEHLTDLSDGSLTGSKVGTGIVATYITTGTLPDSVIPSTVTRDSELTAGLATKQDANTNLTTFANITPSANIISLLTAADYPAVRGLLDLEPGVDFLSPAGVTSAITSGITGKQDVNTHLTDLADGSLTGSKV